MTFVFPPAVPSPPAGSVGGPDLVGRDVLLVEDRSRLVIFVHDEDADSGSAAIAVPAPEARAGRGDRNEHHDRVLGEGLDAVVRARDASPGDVAVADHVDSEDELQLLLSRFLRRILLVMHFGSSSPPQLGPPACAIGAAHKSAAPATESAKKILNFMTAPDTKRYGRCGAGNWGQCEGSYGPLPLQFSFARIARGMK